MADPVSEWVAKAEEDYQVALSLRRVRRYKPHSSVCFHAQQCIEKYLKAILEMDGATIRKVHALPALLDQCARGHAILAPMRPDVVRLFAYAVEFRYPGESASLEDAKEAVLIMKRSRSELCQELKLS
jgi:HEPN domain-containing protein